MKRCIVFSLLVLCVSGSFLQPNPASVKTVDRCAAHQKTLCGSACVNTQTSATNCGTCGTTCPSVAHGVGICTAGTCAIQCGKAYTLCGSSCANLNTNVTNCGSCGIVCPAPPSNGVASCKNGQCGFTCSKGYTQCGNVCVNVKTDVKNCNTCGNACSTSDANATSTCSNGKCGKTCNAGYVLCGNMCVNELTDSNNCGACGKTCKANNPNGAISCNSGVCSECDAPNSFCGATCTNPAIDPSNCGACGTVCTTTDPNASPACANGGCGVICSANYPSQCGTAASSTCVNEQTDTHNCGACGATCSSNDANSVPTCAAGGCQFACVGSLSQCGTPSTNGVSQTGSTCIDTSSDTTNCGGCGNVCKSDDPNAAVSGCSNGACQFVCTAGFPNQCGTPMVSSTGQQTGSKCVDYQSDPANCGSCGNACQGGVCVSGSCSPCGSPYQNGVEYDISGYYPAGYIDTIADCCALCIASPPCDVFTFTDNYQDGYGNGYCVFTTLKSGESCDIQEVDMYGDDFTSSGYQSNCV